jgi:hypothetical protein
MLHIGDRHAGADNTDRLVALLLKFFDPHKLLTDITHDDALRLRTWRRKQHTEGRPPADRGLDRQ